MRIKRISLLALIPAAGFNFWSALAQTEGEIEYYRNLNNHETRLIEYRDNDEALMLKLKQLAIINNSRKKFKVPPVKLDILASRVANRMSREAAENNYVSHWNLNGEKPYHRFAFAGGYDHVSENAYGEWTSGTFDTSPAGILALMKKGHNSFMAEKAPADGHKRNITDKAHNYVGIGFHITGNQFRYYEEFINRYLDISKVPSQVSPDEEVSLRVDTRGESYLFYLVSYFERFPVPLKPGQKPRQGSYEDFSGEVVHRIPAWELARYRQGTIYEIPLRFTREGLYYIQIYTDPREIRTPGKLTTKGRPPVSGIVIKVAGRR